MVLEEYLPRTEIKRIEAICARITRKTPQDEAAKASRLVIKELGEKRVPVREIVDLLEHHLMPFAKPAMVAAELEAFGLTAPRARFKQKKRAPNKRENNNLPKLGLQPNYRFGSGAKRGYKGPRL